MADKKEGMFTEGKEKGDVQRTDHDGFFREVLSYPEIRIPFLKRHLGKEILSHLDVEKLFLQKDTFVDKEYRKTASDLVFATENKDKFVYMLLEHQSTPDPEIAMRFAKYEMRILENFRKQYPDRKYPTVFQVLIYNGEKQYDVSTSFWDLFEDPKTREMVANIGYRLIDLRAMEHAEKYGILEFFGKHLQARNEGLLELLEKILKKLYNIESIEDRVLLMAIIRYVAVKHPNREELENFLKKYGGKNMEAVKGSFAYEYKQEGIQEGIQQEQRQIAKNLLFLGVDVSTIQKATGLSQEEIEKIQQKNQ